MNTKNLLFDLGNTRLKWALCEGTEMRAGIPIVYADEGLASGLAQRWRGLQKPQHVWVASVAGAAREAELAAVVREHFSCDITFVRSVANACGVQNAYAQPDRLGIDRFLALIALHQAALDRGQHTPLLLASCGTALTLDVLAADGQHRGGLIAPSPELMQRALYDNTAQLRPSNKAQLVELADNTADAIHSGTWLAAVALVERVQAQATKYFGTAPTLILSGGAAGELQTALGGLGRIEPELVLHGLSVYADAHWHD